MPEVKHLGDVSDIKGYEIEPVDIITFGSPCQDMSIAGKRAGLNGSRSNLFYEAIRIIKKMRERTNGTKPRYTLWENVPGAFSSNKGEDFKKVLKEICEIKGYQIDAPRPNRWQNAGLIIADDFNLAWRVFDVAADMVRMCPVLNKRVKILASQKRIVFQPTNSFYQVLSAEAYSKHGFNIHGVVFDELHTQPNRKLFDVMTKGSGDARTQPLYFLITTAGTDTHSICYETHQKAKDILEGRKIDPTFYPVIYGADEKDDWTDPKVWKKANPSLGVTVGIDKVKATCESAKQNPGEENSFRQLRLNQWVKQAIRWMPMEKWDSCSFSVNEDELEGRVCYGGLDLSSTTDITAFVLVFPPTDEKDKIVILPYFWLPEETLELRVKRDHVPYDIWERQGYIQTTEGNVVHYGYIESFIEKLGERFNIREIAFDRWGAVQMVQNLENMGFTVVPFGQGFKDMSPPTKELMKLTLEQKIAHGGHPVLRWNMDNIFIRTDPAGNIKADKEKSAEKIDGAIATIMALDRAIRCGDQNTESVYDSRGILFM